MTSAVRVSCGLYKMLLFTYPSDFRLRFESEMITTFSDLIYGEWKHNGLPGVARVWGSAVREVFSVAVPLRLRSPMVIATSLSLLLSIALFMAVFHAMTHVCNGEQFTDSAGARRFRISLAVTGCELVMRCDPRNSSQSHPIADEISVSRFEDWSNLHYSTLARWGMSR
jgi:hypothetical protein